MPVAISAVADYRGASASRLASATKSPGPGLIIRAPYQSPNLSTAEVAARPNWTSQVNDHKILIRPSSLIRRSSTDVSPAKPPCDDVPTLSSAYESLQRRCYARAMTITAASELYPTPHAGSGEPRSGTVRALDHDQGGNYALDVLGSVLK